MRLSQKSLESLREMINEKTSYRSGPKLVSFFNQLGFRDQYGQGFPSRWVYTNEKLATINGRPELDTCIKMIFNPAEFIGREDDLRECLKVFNQYLAYDGWMVVIKNTGVEIHRAESPDIEAKLKDNSVASENITVDEFLRLEIEEIQICHLPIEEALKPVLESRMMEMKSCFKAKAYLSVIILAGSMLEGILLSLANRNPKVFNQSSVAPKTKDGKVKYFQDWTLNNLIDVANAVGFLKIDVARFSHALRDFRNYIHPYQQMTERFFPDENTAKICMQVLKGALLQIKKMAALPK